MKTFASLIVSAVGLALVLASPAEAAKTSKYKKSAKAVHATKHRVVASARPLYWGTEAVPKGPLYNGQDYLGDDPDPNIRALIIKDLSGRYGGSF